MRATTPRSWVISSSAMPCSACNCASSSRICAWIVTSSAVVGSSATSTSGSTASAAAIITRCLRPPESWNGYSPRRRAASGTPTFSSSAIARACAGAPRRPVWRSRTSVICRPTVRTGLSAVAGSWKIIATRRPRTARIAASGRLSRSCASSSTRPAAIRAASGSSRSTDSAAIDLPQPDSPTSARHSPRASSRSTPSTAHSAPCGVSMRVRRPSSVSTALMPPPRALRRRAPGDRSRRVPHPRTGLPRAPAQA
jgi:hypothetical protein